MLNKGPGMIDDVIQRPPFLSGSEGGGEEGGGLTFIDGYDSENTSGVRDEAIRRSGVTNQKEE